MTDQDKAKAIERANSYRDMMNSWAWKDFMLMAKSIKEDAARAIDNMSFDQNTNFYIAEARGMRKGIQQLLDDVESIVSDPV